MAKKFVKIINERGGDATLVHLDCACCVQMGKNVFANHGLTVMSIGIIIIEEVLCSALKLDYLR